jgi:hypothetical protein
MPNENLQESRRFLWAKDLLLLAVSPRRGNHICRIPDQNPLPHRIPQGRSEKVVLVAHCGRGEKLLPLKSLIGVSQFGRVQGPQVLWLQIGDVDAADASTDPFGMVRIVEQGRRCSSRKFPALDVLFQQGGYRLFCRWRQRATVRLLSDELCQFTFCLPFRGGLEVYPSPLPLAGRSPLVNHGIPIAVRWIPALP